MPFGTQYPPSMTEHRFDHLWRRTRRATCTRLLLLLVLLSMSTLPLLAQEREDPTPAAPPATERQLMMYRIYQTLEQDGYHFAFLYEDPWQGKRPPFEGLFEGSSGAAKSVYKNAGRADGAADHLGRATVYSATDSMVTVHVELADTSQSDMRVYEGDVVELATDIPELEERTTFFELTRLAIRFLDADRNPMFNREMVLYRDGPALRDSLLAEMVSTIHTTAEAIRPLIDPGGDWDIRIEDGRFAGNSMVDAMDSTKAEDIHNFLLFVESYPGKYLGQDWRIDETYATWLINAAPPGAEEMKNLFLDAYDTPEFDRLLALYADELADGIFTDTWNNEAEAIGDEGRYEEAMRLTEVVERIATHLDDASMRGFMLFSRADVARSMEEYERAVSMFEEAIELFRAENNLYGESIAVNNLGSTFDDLERYDEAIETFRASIELKNQRLLDNPSLDLRSSQAASWYGLGSALNSLSRFEEAIDAYRTADSLYVSEGSLSSQRYHLNTLNEIGKALRKLDRNAEAMAAFEQARQAALLLGDVEAEADALDEIAYQTDDDEAQLALFTEAYELHVQSGSLRDAGYSQSQIGQTLWRLKRLDEAIAAHRKAIELREQAGFTSGQAYSWLKLGGLYKDAGDPVRAIEAYDTAAALYDQVDNRSGSADVLEDLGDLFIEEGDFRRAIETHSRALEIRQDLGLQYESATSMSDIANAHFKDGAYGESQQWYQRAADLRRSIGDQSGLIDALANLGNLAYFHDRDYDRSQQLLRESISLAADLDNAYLQGYGYSRLGSVARDTGRYQEALEYETQALSYFSDVDDVVMTLVSMGYLQSSLGHFDEARSRFEEARDRAEAASSRRDLGYALTALADLEIAMGRARQALPLSMQSLRIAEEVNNSWGMASAHMSIGNAYNVMGMNELAIQQYTISDSLNAETGSELSRATPANNIGTIHYHQGDFEASLPYFQKAYRIQQEHQINDDFMVNLLGNIGAVHMKMGHFEEAESWVNRALALNQELGLLSMESGLKVIAGELYFKTGRIQEASDILEEALQSSTEAGRQNDRAEALRWIGEVWYAQGMNQEAISALEESVRISREMNDLRKLWQPLSALGPIYRSEGRLADGVAALQESVNVLEQLSQRLAFGEGARDTFARSDGRLETYEQLVAMLIQLGRTEEALQLIERTGLEAIRANLAAVKIEFENPEMTAALEDDRRRKQELAELDKQITEQKAKGEANRQGELIDALEQRRNVLAQEYVAFVNGTVRQYPELQKHLTDSVNPGDFNRARRSIPEDTAVLAYLIGNENTFIFTATRDSVGAVSIPVSSSVINSLVNDVHRAVSKPGTGPVRGTEGASDETPDVDIRSTLNDLYRLLIEPIESEIEGKNHLAIIPSGSLHKLPFQILSDMENGRPALFTNHTIFYTSKLNIFDRPAMGGGVNIVAFGNADESLDWAEREVNEIAKMDPGTQVFVRGDATESRVKHVSPDYNVLHLATHGTLDYNDFQNSFLTLAPDATSNDDGQLTIGEIWSITGLDNYRLVTLSACETAVNDDIANGWPISPANAFLDHVPSVIASLWKVDDVATSLLMQRFYENLESKGAAEALQLAQLSLSQDENYSDPFYWAPFVVMGDWR